MPEVTARFRAKSPDEVHAVGSWMHDAVLDWDNAKFAPARRLVTLPLAQEALAAFNQPGKRLLRKGRLGWKVYEVTFIRCEILVRNARDLVVDDDGRDEPGELNAVKVEGNQVHVRPSWSGPAGPGHRSRRGGCRD